MVFCSPFQKNVLKLCMIIHGFKKAIKTDMTIKVGRQNIDLNLAILINIFIFILVDYNCIILDCITFI